MIYPIFERNTAMRLQSKIVTNGILSLGLLLGLVVSARALSPVEQVSALAEQGNMKAQAALGSSYSVGRDGLMQDKIKAFYWLRKAADQGDASAQYLTGFNYREGDGVRQDYQKALYWLKKSSDQGYARAQFSLGIMYSDGEGVSLNKSIAKEWFGKACDNGEQYGCDSYRWLHEQGY